MKKNSKIKIAIILGTRPEIIKMSPIIRQCKKQNIDFFIIHSNQHYAEKLDKIFFKELNLPRPKYNLNVGSGKHGEITGRMLLLIEEILIKESPSRVLVQGDTNTVLAGGLAARKLNIPVGHIEAGLRSYDEEMPEEVNRVLVDHLAAYLFPPTELAKRNLVKEGIDKNRIYVTGNTVVDSLFENLEIANRKSKIMANLKINSKQYILATAHRQENVDNKVRLINIMDGLSRLSKELKIPVIIPAHPRLIKMLEIFAIKVGDTIKFIPPLGYLDFLVLEKNALVIATDSGGVQEEACVLNIPCITLRNNTERPETIDVGANILVGTNPDSILRGGKKILKNVKKWKNPFGTGHAAEKIITIIIKQKL
ncbi:MAG: UDP-N-acetylglucosamine 2-epimerase (non-hydrolyzing) [Candidatus Falkowbacteria bacterium]